MVKNNSVAELNIEEIAGMTAEEAMNTAEPVVSIRPRAVVTPKSDLDIEAIAKVTQAEIERGLPVGRSTMQSPQVQTVVRVENHFGVRALTRYKGQTPNPIQSRSRTYWSKAKGLSFYIDENTLLQFQNNNFVTDKDDIIDYLENHPAFQVMFWKDKLPEAIIKIKNHDKEFLTTIKGEYN